MLALLMQEVMVDIQGTATSSEAIGGRSLMCIASYDSTQVRLRSSKGFG